LNQIGFLAPPFLKVDLVQPFPKVERNQKNNYVAIFGSTFLKGGKGGKG
jgi:hypothetical protein